MPTTTELTKQYISQHPDVKSCLRKGLVNYSALSRLIASELGIEKKTSTEAILIAARRYREELKESKQEKKIRSLLRKSEIEIKNKIGVFIFSKVLSMDVVAGLQKKAKEEAGTLYVLEGSDHYTIIANEKYGRTLAKKYHMVLERGDLALINFKTPKEIETTSGVMAYVTSLFAEHEVNIIELLSCYTDNLFVIEKKDLGKALAFLEF